MHGILGNTMHTCLNYNFRVGRHTCQGIYGYIWGMYTLLFCFFDVFLDFFFSIFSVFNAKCEVYRGYVFWVGGFG